MARCQLTGKGASFGRNVSHSNRKSSRQFLPNVQNATFPSAALGRNLRLAVTTRVQRTVQKHGGIDAFLVHTDDRKLTPEAQRLKRQIQKALSGHGKARATA